MLKRISLSILLLLVGLPAVSLGFELTGFSWIRPVPYEVNTSSSQELGRDTTLEVVSASYAVWRDPSCSDFQYTYEGETQGDYRTGDQINTVCE